MKMTLHHLNLTTTNVAKMDDFYRNVMGLAEEPNAKFRRASPTRAIPAKRLSRPMVTSRCTCRNETSHWVSAKSSSSIRWSADILHSGPTISLLSRSF